MSHPACFDTLALKIARRFTDDHQVQKRAQLQVEIVEALVKVAAQPVADRTDAARAPLPNREAVTLRDHFAGIAWHAELTTCGVPGPACDALIKAAGIACRSPEMQMARNAFELADVMLAARSHPDGAIGKLLLSAREVIRTKGDDLAPLVLLSRALQAFDGAP